MALKKSATANVALSDTFESWRTKTNLTLSSLGSNTVTVSNTVLSDGTSKAITTGHGKIHGDLSTHNLFANVALSGGQKGRLRDLTIATNTTIQSSLVVNSTAVSTISGPLNLKGKRAFIGNTVYKNESLLNYANSVVNNAHFRVYTETLSNNAIANSTSGTQNYTINLNRGSVFKLEYAGNTNVIFANAKVEQAHSFTLISRSVTGKSFLTFGSNVFFTAGQRPNTYSTSAGNYDIFTFFTYDGEKYFGSQSIIDGEQC